LKRIISLLLVFLCAVPLFSGRDVLVDGSGEEFVGELLEITADSVIFRTNSSVLRLPRSDVYKLSLSQRREGEEWQTIADVTDTILLRAYDNKPSPEDYPMSSYVVLFSRKQVVVQPDSSYRIVIRRIYEVFDERGKRAAGNASVDYFPDTQRAKVLFARTISPEGRFFHLDDAAIEDANLFSFIPQYNRKKRLKFALGEVRVGSIVDYAFEITGRKCADPALFSLLFQGKEPVIHSEFSISFPPGSSFPHSSRDVELREEKNSFYASLENIPLIHPERYMPPFSYISPRVDFSLDSDWNYIGRQIYRSFRDSLDMDVYRLIDSITSGCEDKLAQARKLFYFVSQDIREADVPIASFRYIPRRLSSILEDRYANGLDKVYLLWALLDRVGIRSYPLFFSTVSSGHPNSDVPSIGWFDEVALEVVVGRKRYYCYPAIRDIKFDVLPSDVWLDTVFRVTSDGGELVNLERKLDVNTTSRKIVLTLDENADATVHDTLSFCGVLEADKRSIRNWRDEEIKKHFEERASKFFPSARLVDYKVVGLGTMDSTLSECASFDVKDFAVPMGESRLGFQVRGTRNLAWLVGEQSRSYPFMQAVLERYEYSYDFILPNGFYVYYTPEDVKVDNDYFRITAHFEPKKGRLTLSIDLLFKSHFIPPEEYAHFKQYIEELSNLSEKWIIIQKG